MKNHSNSRSIPVENANTEQIDWELRPGGMLVQKRDDEEDGVGGTSTGGPMINVRVAHGPSVHQINLPSQSTFGDLKRILAHDVGLEPKDQRLLFRGKEKEDNECLHTVGVKDMSKVLLLEDPGSKERKVEERKKKLEDMKKDRDISKACEPVNKVRVEVDKLAEKVSLLESAVLSGTKVQEKEFVVLTELLMVQLLKLDSIEAEGEVKAQRRNEVRRVQSLVEKLDNLKARNTNPFSDSGKEVSVTTKWEKFDSGFGSLSAPPPKSSSEATQDWEAFD